MPKPIRLSILSGGLDAENSAGRHKIGYLYLRESPEGWIQTVLAQTICEHTTYTGTDLVEGANRAVQTLNELTATRWASALARLEEFRVKAKQFGPDTNISRPGFRPQSVRFLWFNGVSDLTKIMAKLYTTASQSRQALIDHEWKPTLALSFPFPVDPLGPYKTPTPWENQ